ncbi:Aldo/keto reductase [Rhizophagus irregularis]|uniref:Aldo/keto reductase n=1 Tax=Rhizophagus irregularis TaxID=588596 RepID=A0A2N0R1A3_9GLOM|nr:Aldo/keto reductase [Rhizophagus irregularis]
MSWYCGKIIFTFGEQWKISYLIICKSLNTACNYNYGEGERFLGDYVSDKRSDVVIATKYTCNTTSMQKDVRLNPNLGGNHRKSLVENLNESLKRLNMSYVDILYVHIYEFRTPIEEIMRSLDDAVRSGKVLYVAASNFPSWALARANTFAELRGWSLLDRSLEFDLQPACAELDVGIIPWGAVAEGFLTGKHTRESAANLKSEHRSHKVADHSKVEKNWKILDEVITVSKETGRTPVQVAMNWVQQKPGITSPLIGARTVTQLEENLKSLEFKLTPEQVKRLDEASKPAEIPFPNSFVSNYDRFIGKNIEVPRKFEAISTSCNFGRINL